MQLLPLMLQIELSFLGSPFSRYLWSVNTTIVSVDLGATSFGANITFHCRCWGGLRRKLSLSKKTDKTCTFRPGNIEASRCFLQTYYISLYTVVHIYKPSVALRFRRRNDAEKTTETDYQAVNVRRKTKTPLQLYMQTREKGKEIRNASMTYEKSNEKHKVEPV